jgi:Bacterial Ig domain
LINPNSVSSKVSNSTGVESQDLFIFNPRLLSHNPNLQNTTVPTWTEFLQSPTPFNLKIEIQDLPTGQLAEATITGYDINNRPNSGTLTLDTDGNSLGWFIDTTPEDNTEFDQTITPTAYRATTGAAAGKYDLLTTILHELGHLNGIIRGNTAFDTHVQNINGIPTFINGGITAQLTPDGSHLDSTLYPYDLMNTSLKPGVRKLPSSLDLAILNTIWSNQPTTSQQINTTAHLTAGALIGITNGDFTTPTTWNTLGATNIINGTATLTEQSQKLSELTQAFIIPTGAKTLQFTIKDNHLVTGDTTKTANDAFEVALLDTNTFTPLAGTSQGLTNTDSLLNIQANGTIHKSDKVTITALGNNSSIVTIDLTQITPTTQATLYFNLLGFGARTSTVTIDDVKLFTDTQPIPVTNNDTLTTNQNTPLTLDPTQLTTNDTNVTQIQIINQPTHGTLLQAPDGKLTYQPVSTYVGNDSFTYLGFGSDGQISNLATVNLTVNNLPPTIETVLIPNQINERQTIQLSALAKDGGSIDNLIYT